MNKKDIHKKSLEMMDKLFSGKYDDFIEKEFEEIDKMDFGGPTLDEVWKSLNDKQIEIQNSKKFPIKHDVFNGVTKFSFDSDYPKEIKKSKMSKSLFKAA